MNLRDLHIDRSWTLFLDRDGVINRRIVGGYVTAWEEFEFLPGVLEALKGLSRIFGRIIVVSNQQGVSKGLMTMEDVELIHSSMVRQIEGARGRIDLVLYAPYAASDNSPMRKPGIGMALEAQRHFPEIEFGKSIMVGDSESDMSFGRNAGMKTVLVTKRHNEIDEIANLIDFSFPDLISFSREV